jgi:hypothetical protein
MLAVRQHDAGNRHLVERADCFADHGISVVADLAVGDKIVGPHQVEIVDLAARHDLVDVDGACGFERDILEFVITKTPDLPAGQI